MTDAVRRRGRVTLRQGLVLIFVLGSIGLGAELVLLGHLQEWRQQVPLVLLVSGLVLVAVNLVCKRPVVLRIFRLAMLALRVGRYRTDSGFISTANMAFELEMNSKLTRLGPGVQDGRPGPSRSWRPARSSSSV